MATRPVLDGSGRTSLPAMAAALVAAEKQRRMDMDNVRLGSGQTALSMTVPAGHPLADWKLRLTGYYRQDDGTLRVVFRRDPNGVGFSAQKANPGNVNYSEAWDHSAGHARDMPRFGKTSCAVVLDNDNQVVVTVPSAREPLVFRRLKPREKGREAAPAPAVGPSRDEFRAAVRCVNAFKARLGEALELRVSEDGTLRGTIMEEFQ